MEQNLNKFVEALYQGMYDKLEKVAFRLVGNVETAKELVQDVFVLAVSRKKELYIHPNPEGWLMRVTLNLGRNERRRHSHFDLSLEELYDMPAVGPAPPLEDMLPAKLTAEEKQTLIWRYEQGLEYREMADRLGITEAGCRSRVSRAIEKCRRLMREEE